MSGADFWNDRKKAEQISRHARVLKDIIASWEHLDSQLLDLVELQEMATEEGDSDALGEV